LVRYPPHLPLIFPGHRARSKALVSVVIMRVGAASDRFDHTKFFCDTELTSQEKSCDSILVRSHSRQPRRKVMLISFASRRLAGRPFHYTVPNTVPNYHHCSLSQHRVDTVGVLGSNPHAPTNGLNTLAAEFYVEPDLIAVGA